MQGWGRTWWLRYCLDYIGNWNSLTEDIKQNVSGYGIDFCLVTGAGIWLLFSPAGCLCWSWFRVPRALFLMLALILGYSVVPSVDGEFCGNQQKGIYTFADQSLGVVSCTLWIWTPSETGYNTFIHCEAEEGHDDLDTAWITLTIGIQWLKVSGEMFLDMISLSAL